MRATIGLGVAIGSAVMQQTLMPYADWHSNQLAIATQWQIAFTFFTGLVITGRPFGYDPTVLGVLLTMVNLSTIVMFLKFLRSGSSNAKIGDVRGSFVTPASKDKGCDAEEPCA